MNKPPFGIVIVAHGNLAIEYLATIHHVIGIQDGIIAVSIQDMDQRDDKRREIENAVDKVDTGGGVVIATDMFGGTPSNLAQKSLQEHEGGVLYGVNMPSLIKLARSRQLPIPEAVAIAVDAGHRYLNFCNPRKSEMER